MKVDLKRQISILEEELAEMQRQVEEADKASAEHRRSETRQPAGSSAIEDILPMRDRIQVLEHKIARLKKQA